jgi:hypothetical protein
VLTPVPKQLILPVAFMLLVVNVHPISQLLMLLETTAPGTKMTLKAVENMMTMNSMLSDNVALVAEVVQLLMVTAHPISQLLMLLETTAPGIKRTH